MKAVQMREFQIECGEHRGRVRAKTLVSPLPRPSKCFICQWIATNENLTEREREILRKALRPPSDVEPK